MKKILLSIAVVATGFWAQSQVICAGVSPASVVGNYDFFWADPAGGDWACPDFLVPGTFVEDTLIMVNDGTPGVHPAYGHLMAEQGCNASPANAYDGKIAVLYRGDCQFGTKAMLAENAGAVAVIIINHTGDAVGMAGGNDGLNVTIPVVMIGEQDGADIVAEMQNGPVVMFLGNKVGAFVNDAGANSGEMLISPYGGAHDAIYDGFTPGIQAYNFGSATQDVTVIATIDGPSGQVYADTVGPITMNTGDTLPIFPGNGALGGYEFTAWSMGVGNYPTGDYTLTYTVSIPNPDDSDFDNILSSDFKVQGDVLGLSRLDASNMPISNNYPSNSTTEYQSCMMIQEPSYNGLAALGMYFVGHSDTAYAGTEIFVNAYQWDDAWVDLDDANYTFDPATNDAFQNLNLITFADYFPASDSEIDQVVYAEFGSPFYLADGARYLFCLQTFESTTISFGYDAALNYDGNQGILRQPISPVHVDGSWYVGGWSGVSAPAMAINTSTAGLESTTMLNGSAFPNPAVDVVTIAVDGEGSAVLEVTDIAGKLAFNKGVKLVNGQTKVDVSSLESGIYIFNVTFEDGQSSTFNVIKK